jgi:heme/copper-type cytochrome/quinol oxidase subunit 1
VMFFLAIAGTLAMFGWGSELAGDSSVPHIFFSVTSLLILGPLAAVVLALLGTVALTRRPPVFKAPLVQALGLIAALALALPAMAIMLALATGRAGHTSQWWVGAWHMLLVGGSTFGVFCALYYWAPKLWGRHLSAGLGGLQMLATLGGVVLGFVPLLVVGAQGMHRRVSTYSNDSWGPANLISTIGSYLVALAVVLVVLNVAVSIGARRGKVAEDDPWEGGTLEWATTSPPPPHNFDTLPDIRSERPVYDLRHAPPGAGREAAGAGEGDEEREAITAGASV